ncbi:hypothetical protein Cabther_A0933 [Chloracidobacterium thermophilum B]|uniref:Uncharacterized protein n=1 Tax=Chloracidobacterium thermophilum (strain B) TaxID=981222 RepID=G2LFP6_CHLTF|nr:hypothetical protein Cabther_A0933 [Chloracidobacterium thermophilum B]
MQVSEVPYSALPLEMPPQAKENISSPLLAAKGKAQ